MNMDAKPQAELPPLLFNANIQHRASVRFNRESYVQWQKSENDVELRTARVFAAQVECREEQLLQERKARIKAEAALEAAALSLEETANLYEMYAKHPRDGADPALMLRSAVDYREAARLVHTNQPKEQQ